MSLPRFFEESRHPLARDTVIIAFPKGGGEPGDHSIRDAGGRMQAHGVVVCDMMVVVVVVVEKQIE